MAAQVGAECSTPIHFHFSWHVLLVVFFRTVLSSNSDELHGASDRNRTCTSFRTRGTTRQTVDTLLYFTNTSTDIVGKTGIEPARPLGQRGLSSSCLPSSSTPPGDFMPRPSVFDEATLRDVVPLCLSYAEVIKKVGLIPAGGNYTTLKRKCQLYQIDTSHFIGSAWNQGNRYRPIQVAVPLSEILVENSTYKTYHLGQRLLKEKVLTRECSRCSLTEWQDAPIPLELDHVNGNNTDHRIENLRFLCCNCHALTSTWRRRKSA